MQLQTSALLKIKDLIEAILGKMNEISKPSRNFFGSVLDSWFVIPGRYTFSTLSRYGRYCDKSLRLQFERGFDFVRYNRLLIRSKCGKELIAAFDPSFVHKSGKNTPGLSWFWSGKDQRSLKGLEISGLAIVDVAARTAMSLCSVQTPDRDSLKAAGKDLVDHYVNVISDQLDTLKSLVKYLAVDGYFMKQEFILPLLEAGLHVITKMRPDANLRYLYTGGKKKGRGRPKVLDGKVNCKQIDKRRFKEFFRDKHTVCYSAKVYCVILKKIPG